MHRILSYIFIACLALLSVGEAFAQTPTDLPNRSDSAVDPALQMEFRVRKAAYKGDSISFITYPTVYKYPPMTFKSEKDRENFNRLVRNVKYLLPYAKMVHGTIVETYQVLQLLPDEKARKHHIDAMEAELKREYTPVLKKMTRSQGRLLVKLIDRECNMSGYNIAQAFIGAFRANVYQGVAFIFGLNLNKKYDPEGDDRYTERVVRLVESGQI